MSRFDAAGKPPSWYTAFYYLAEHIRVLTGGAINHKGFYALVGTEGRYLNHDNPTVRKSTAGALSRLIHSRGYLFDMRERHLQSYSVFAQAAREVCRVAAGARGWGDSELFGYLRDSCWPDVRQGLANERGEWRADLDLERVDIEMDLLFAALARGDLRNIDVRIATGSDTGLLGEGTSGRDASEVLLASLLHLITFGRLNVVFARDLLDRYPTGFLTEREGSPREDVGACLVKFVDSQHSALVATWQLPGDRPFTIGRYTDCDVVETDPGISRAHCSLYFKGGSWNFEDRRSRNGSRVMRDGACAYDSIRDGAGVAFPLRHGDALVLSGRSHFWFGALMQRPGA